MFLSFFKTGTQEMLHQLLYSVSFHAAFGLVGL